MQSAPGGVADLDSREVWQRLEQDRSAQLIDVRTRAEWSFVGLPDLTGLGREPMLIEWQTFPDSRVDPAFPNRLASALAARGAGSDTALYFICRSGQRSRLAAQAMAQAGFTRCHNVADGFEGPLDGSRHRGLVAGWKAAGLPWVQA